MTPKSRRERLAELARLADRGDIVPASSLPPPVGGGQAGLRRAAPISLAEACPGGKTVAGGPAGGGAYWLLRRPVDGLCQNAERLTREYVAVLKGARQRFDEIVASAEMCLASQADPTDLLFMDLETCGFSGSPIFLAGMLAYDGRRLEVRQCLARDYSEEPAVLDAFLSRLARAKLLVTFNGKAYDMTMIRDRSAFHGLAMPDPAAPHLDLLHEARRHLKGQLPNCRLQTLERHFCGRLRVDDIPGSMIPQAYHQFVDTGDARDMRHILHHNLLDLITMVELLVALLTSTSRT